MPRILVVEDSKFQHKAIVRLLKNHDFETDSAFNGKEGLEKVKESEFDLIMSDILMPEMDGLEMIKCLRDEGFTKPVVILSSDIQDSVKAQATELGVHTFINKPLKENEVMLAINAAIA